MIKNIKKQSTVEFSAITLNSVPVRINSKVCYTYTCYSVSVTKKNVNKTQHAPAKKWQQCVSQVENEQQLSLIN